MPIHVINALTAKNSSVSGALGTKDYAIAARMHGENLFSSHALHLFSLGFDPTVNDAASMKKARFREGKFCDTSRTR
jgi:hypothetical protein